MNLGSPAENRTARILESFGYLVASRRHVGGAGDLMAVPSIVELFETLTVDGGAEEEVPRLRRPLLVEVKRGTGNPWEHFRRPDRRAMITAGYEYNLTPLLAYWPWHPGNGKQPVWLEVSDWP